METSQAYQMATLPYFVFSPNTLLSLVGVMRGKDSTPSTPAGDWRHATVDVVIPAHNEEKHIVLCLESLLRQTLRPKRIVLVDDGSTDQTAARARAFCEFHGLELTLIQRRQSIGKTPTIRQHARESSSDVLFVLDADTVLESDDYIRQTVQELYKSAGIASVCGTVLPMRERDRRASEEAPAVRSFTKAFPSYQPPASKSWPHRLASAVTNTYREVLYVFLQRFIYRGHMALFGTMFNPVGCAVAYRREYLEALFDHFEPLLGDDLTNSEDIFIGLAMLDAGYRNMQVADVYARTVEPEVQHLLKQVYLWSSAFLQSSFYFDALLKSPFKSLKRWRQRRNGNGPDGTHPTREERSTSTAPFVTGHLEPAAAAAGSGGYGGTAAVRQSPLLSVGQALDARVYFPAEGSAPNEPGLTTNESQTLGREHTKKYGRPVGWALLFSAIEKIGFPTALLLMAIFARWEALIVTVCAETIVVLAVLMAVTRGQRLRYLLKGIAISPIRYVLIFSELVTVTRFASDMWLTKNRGWRK
jgi:glycosyltransferase involved in cell wall biosynthesis